MDYFNYATALTMTNDKRWEALFKIPRRKPEDKLHQPHAPFSFALQKVLEEQNGYFHFASEPRTVSAKEHRPAYATDGDYFSNPNAEDVFEAVYSMMNEADPKKYPELY